MATGDYLTVPELRSRLGIDAADPSEDTRLAQVIAAASRSVDTAAGRRFFADTVATARTFIPANFSRISLGQGGDISSLTGILIAVDYTGDGTYSTPWTASQWTAPEVYGGDGRLWPYTTLVARWGEVWPMRGMEPTIRVTALWGWPGATPTPVVEAAALVAAELWKLRDAPLGTAGFGQFGVATKRGNPVAMGLLQPFVHGAGIG